MFVSDLLLLHPANFHIWCSYTYIYREREREREREGERDRGYARLFGLMVYQTLIIIEYQIQFINILWFLSEYSVGCIFYEPELIFCTQ